MIENPDYPELNQLFGVYLNEDYSYWGSTIEEVVACYKRDSGADCIREILDEIERFEKSNPADLEEAFKREYGSQFWPHLWGHTVASFFAELTRLLKG